LYPPKPGWDLRLKEKLARQRPAALGETGFDRNAQREQEQITQRQIDLAESHRLPLILHCVGDGSSLLKAVRNHPAPVMLHRCLGRPARYQPWWEAGVYLSVGPEVRDDLRLLEAVPPHLLLLESDAEDESQAPWTTLPKLYLAAGRAKGLKADALKTLVTNNFQRFLGELA
jgi:Tat protein secretion system quality control protein TatD with DNase activity